MSRALRGDHCQCPTCGEYFNSTAAFDKHRTGPYSDRNVAWAARRCLSRDEMRGKGMQLSATGWWCKCGWQGPVLPVPAI
jgi:hypothetical protein